MKTGTLNLDDIDFDSVMEDGMTGDDSAPEPLDPITVPKKDETSETPSNNGQASEEEENDQEEEEGAEEEASDAKVVNDGEEEESDGEDDSTPSAPGTEESLIDEIKSKIGFEIEGDFDDSPDGLLELTRTATEVMSNLKVKSIFEQFPDVGDYFQYRLNGGNGDQFFKTVFADVDYSKVSINESDSLTQETILRKSLELSGLEPDDISKSISGFKSSGLLFEQAEMARKGLVKHQAVEKQRLLDEQEAMAEQAEEKQNQFWSTVETTIKKGSSFKGVLISEKEKSEIINYMKLDVGGSTQFQKDLNAAPIDTYIAIAALLRKGFDLEPFLSKTAAAKTARSLRDRMRKEKPASAAGSKPKSSKLASDFSNIDYDKALELQ